MPRPLDLNSTRRRADTAAVRRLLRATADELILLADPDVPVYLVVAERASGRLEYQVSDGVPGARSTSYDFADLRAAIACVRGLVRTGWRTWREKPEDEDVP